jgi:hypothetical protein
MWSGCDLARSIELTQAQRRFQRTVERQRSARARIVFDCQTANDPAMLDVYFSMSTSDSGALRDELTRYIAKHLYRITANLGRVKALVELAQSGFAAGAPPTMKEDVIRAAVVFLHATLEDFLRYIGLTYLPSAGEVVLDRIGLIGSSDVLRADKFFLGKLAKYRDKTVDQLISESVKAYLEKISFSDPDDISRLYPSGLLRRFECELGDEILGTPGPCPTQLKSRPRARATGRARQGNRSDATGEAGARRHR